MDTSIKEKTTMKTESRLFVVLAALAVAFATPAIAADKPNVVLMLSDNMGYGDLGVYGSGGELRGMPTPRIDQLASEGMMLTQFFVEPGCTPTRAALLTGRYSQRAGLGSIIIAGTPSTLQDSEVTLAELFKSQGYATAMTGKWHLGGEKQSLPINQGFDEWHVGILQTTDGVLYPDGMRRSGFSEAAIAKSQTAIWESEPGKDVVKKVRPYDLEYRRHIEGDIAEASVKYIKEQAKEKEPFFLYVGWSHVHYPALPHPDFEGKSSAGLFGDAVMELDYRTGQVLDAIKEAGIEDNTIVIWLSDNGPATTQGSNNDFLGSSAGPFRGEVGDALEGSLRVPGMIKWPAKIKPAKSNEMVAIHDFYPTLANIIGAKVPTDRAIDGVDQGDFFLGKNKQSARESLITFMEGEVAAVRWKQWRIYPKQFVASEGNPSLMGVGAYRAEGMGYPSVYNIARDPREQWNQTAVSAFVLGPYMQIVGEYQKSLEKYPNPPAFSMTKFAK
ncbi:steryl-sulfatase [gamma proteobacterium NOR5-3]|nr:steryl-sulfatase [gamma proteobacterium NOR5-3]